MPRPAVALLALSIVLAGCGGIAEAPTQQPDVESARSATATSTPPDSDDDGLPDPLEQRYGSDVDIPDTDGDGLPDGREVELGSNVTRADTDADELGDGREAALGTNPASVDTDEDGFADPIEVRANASELPGADPLHKNVYVEVDYMAGCSLDPVNRTIAAFADAPVSNPDGESGIDLHVVFSGEIPRKSGVAPDAVDDYEDQYGDRGLQGYHYVVLVQELHGLAGFNGARESIAECRGSVFMHELGHSLGLTKNIAGVDSSAVSFHDYPSVMNYNAPRDYYAYSTGDAGESDFDDWALIGDSLDTTAPSTHQLRERHLNGSIGRSDDDGLWGTPTDTPDG